MSSPTNKQQPDYVTRAARKAVDALLSPARVDGRGRYMPTTAEIEQALVLLGRRLLRRAARECAARMRAEEAALQGAESRAERLNIVRRMAGMDAARVCRDAIRALATGGGGDAVLLLGVYP